MSGASPQTGSDAFGEAAMNEEALINGDPDTMSEEAMLLFQDKFVESLISGFSAESVFEEKLLQAISDMPPEKREWFYEPDFTIETLQSIFERYHADFSMKVALGHSRYESGERDIRNSGYQAGSALVSETTQWAYELIQDVICPMDDKRAVTLLGVTISCALASMGDLTPDHEDLICPQVMRVEPQVSFMPKENRTPEYILARIEAVSAQDWTKFKDEIFQRSHEELVEDGHGRSDGYTIV